MLMLSVKNERWMGLNDPLGDVVYIPLLCGESDLCVATTPSHQSNVISSLY